MIKRAFTDHPASVGESYAEHMGMAFGFGAKMIGAGLACLIHGFLPFLFKRTGRDCIEALHHSMVTHRDRRIPAEDPTPVMTQREDRLRAAE
ncbi:DUF6356 family protein [Hyphococcus luteus]|uniref:Capsule biosynthesis protein n=1 Tax=Hyphococcus luteus TaxID=2058213 RepID=A0A2S7K633_9PROT|nr:DUF6356 family protein [Marinicaulis flavus]PQA87974.1 hypothetical protein CW354_06455 [Marinicaulis flavus]